MADVRVKLIVATRRWGKRQPQISPPPTAASPPPRHCHWPCACACIGAAGSLMMTRGGFTGSERQGEGGHGSNFPFAKSAYDCLVAECRTNADGDGTKNLGVNA